MCRAEKQVRLINHQERTRSTAIKGETAGRKTPIRISPALEASIRQKKGLPQKEKANEKGGAQTGRTLTILREGGG